MLSRRRKGVESLSLVVQYGAVAKQLSRTTQPPWNVYIHLPEKKKKGGDCRPYESRNG